MLDYGARFIDPDGMQSWPWFFPKKSHPKQVIESSAREFVDGAKEAGKMMAKTATKFVIKLAND